MKRIRSVAVIVAAGIGLTAADPARGQAPAGSRLYVEDVSGLLVMLPTLAAQIELFEVQNKRLPDFTRGFAELVEQDYLDEAPTNPFANAEVASAVAVIDTPGKDGRAVPVGKAGWVWNSADRKVFATGATEAQLIKLLDGDGLHQRTPPLQAALKSKQALLVRALLNYSVKRLEKKQAANPTLEELRNPGVVIALIPVNPVNGSSEIQAAMWNKADPPVNGTAGWNYDDKAGQIWANCRITPATLPADRSLALDEYRRKGVPDPKGPWTGRTAKDAMRAIKNSGRLPRMDSPKSGQLFERLVSPNNFDSCRDRKRPLDTRLVEATDHLGVGGDMVDAYARAAVAGEVADLELILVHAQAMRAAALLAEMSDEILADKSGNAVAASTRRRAVDQMFTGLSQMIEGSLDVLEQLESSPVERRARMVQEMTKTVPVIVARLPEGKRAAILRQIRALDAPDLQRPLGELASAVEKTGATRTAEVPTQ